MHRTPWAWLLGVLPAVAILAWPAAASAQVSGNQSNPAGGAAIGEVILATAMATVVTAIAPLVALRHRTRSRPARQPSPLPDPVRAVRHLPRRPVRDGDAARPREAVRDRGPAAE